MEFRRDEINPDLLRLACELHLYKIGTFEHAKWQYKASFYAAMMFTAIGVSAAWFSTKFSIPFLLAGLAACFIYWYSLHKFKQSAKEIRASQIRLYRNYRIVDVGSDYVVFSLYNKARRITVDIGNLTNLVINDLMDLEGEFIASQGKAING
ncbi:hypothetical protein L2750_14555 [Shewanella submarina]|uniref:Uncharacterized protein n=1 Tax=Shewanella submarina TaxID=2016376 RepID=A0ABV7GCB7_9GAMM|nr:hypothetical protein [Shewanella submarina]MCL1038352.1 hypothetical protein [Shewanella submarina]